MQICALQSLADPLPCLSSASRGCCLQLIALDPGDLQDQTTHGPCPSAQALAPTSHTMLPVPGLDSVVFAPSLTTPDLRDPQHTSGSCCSSRCTLTPALPEHLPFYELFEQLPPVLSARGSTLTSCVRGGCILQHSTDATSHAELPKAGMDNQSLFPPPSRLFYGLSAQRER